MKVSCKKGYFNLLARLWTLHLLSSNISPQRPVGWHDSELWPGSLYCHPLNRLCICFLLGGIFQRSEHSRAQNIHTHAHAHSSHHSPSFGKSKQELSGRSEPCLMQQDERCCRVVENWSLWSWRVGLNNNKSGETTSMNGQMDRGQKEGKKGKTREKNRNRKKENGTTESWEEEWTFREKREADRRKLEEVLVNDDTDRHQII